MAHIKTLGIDLGKTSFHIIGWDEQERQVKKAKYNRSKLIEFITHLPPCEIAMEGCAGAHWLARKCQEHGHNVKLIPARETGSRLATCRMSGNCGQKAFL